MKKGLLRTTAMTVATVAGFSSMAHADSVLAAMEALMAASGAPEDAFTYESVVSDTDTGFEITGVRMEPEPGDGVVTIERLRIDAIDMTAAESGSPPTFIDMTAEGFFIPADVLDSDAREIFPDGLSFDLGIDYELDPGAQALALDELYFSVPDYGSISISADLTGLSMEAVAGAMFSGPEALSEVALSNASIMLDDEGGLAEIFALAAAEEGMDLDSFMNQAMLPQMQMMGGMFASDPIGAGVVESIVGFVSDYASPQGPLTITASPSSPISLANLMMLDDPTSLPSMLGLGSDYQSGGDSDEAMVEEPAEEGESSLFGADDAEVEQPMDEPGEQASGDGAFATLMAMAEAAGMPDGALTYDQVLSDSPDGFILSNVHFEPEPGDFIEIELLSVAQIDMESIMNGAPPMTLQVAAQGMVIPTDEMDGDIRQLLGTENLKADFFLDYALDPATGDFDVNGLTMEIPDFGTLTFSLNMAQVDPGAVMGMMMMGPEAMSEAVLESAALSFSDDGFMQQMVSFVAEEERMSEAEVVQEIYGELEQMQGMFAGNPIALAAIDAVGEFVEDYQNPDGAIGIVLNPPTPISIADINAASDPSQLPEMLGLVIGY